MRKRATPGFDHPRGFGIFAFFIFDLWVLATLGEGVGRIFVGDGCQELWKQVWIFAAVIEATCCSKVVNLSRFRPKKRTSRKKNIAAEPRKRRIRVRGRKKSE